MAINNVSNVQYNGEFLPDVILHDPINAATIITINKYHRGTRLNAKKRFCLCSLSSKLNVLIFFPRLRDAQKV